MWALRDRRKATKRAKGINEGLEMRIVARCVRLRRMSTTPWETIHGSTRLRTARYKFPGGISRTTVVDLGDKRFIAYSPGIGLEESAAKFIPDDAELFLLSPAAGHISGLEPWRARFPKATVLAEEAPRKRIAKKTTVQDACDLAPLQDTLPADVGLHVVPECRFGEVWLRVEDNDRVYWATCDSLMNIAKLPDKTLLRWVMLAYGLREGLWLTPMFRHLAIKDKQRFREWAIAHFENGQRNVLIPCHGDIDDTNDIGHRIVQLIEQRV